MATPHVSGLVALIASKYPHYSSNNLKNMILSSVDRIPNLSDKVVTGGRINAYSALMQNTSGVHTFIHFPANGTSLPAGVPVDLMVLVTDGINPILNANVNFKFSDGKEFNLLDDGVGMDQKPNDGYYSASWIPHTIGKVYVTISITVNGYEEIVERFVEVTGAIRNHWYGFYLSSSDGNIIRNNDASDNDCGIYLISSDNNTIFNNIASANLNYGIYLSSSNYNIIANNTALDNNYCSVFDSSSFNIVVNNTLQSNDHGLLLYSSMNNLIYHNNFISNTIQAYDDGSNQWDDDYPTGGNYWSDYSGIDELRGAMQNAPGFDGIGDTPYLFDYGQDQYPLMNPVP